ncbi:MAG: rod shape-determining protein RodA [Clostridiales bacterium]|nr:rod shape-determining protein RodA [Clostridiales bacterium]
MMSDTRRRSQAHFEWPLMVAMYALSFFGLLCITMATYDVELSGNAPLLNKILNSRSGMWQSIFILVSPIIIFVIMAIPMEIYRARVGMIYMVVLGLLVVTLVAGEVSNDLKGWLQTGFGRSMQPSEFAKLSIMLMLARYLAKSEKPMARFKEFAKVMMLVFIPVVVILLQGETGTVLVILVMFLVMIFFAGVNLRVILGIVTVGAIGIGAIVVYGTMAEELDYRIVRLIAFLDPLKYEQSGGYQILKSRTAIGSGQLTGIGTFVEGSWTTLEYVPESSTDSIFSVVGESFGFVGCMAVLAVYLFMVLRMLYLARFTQDKFGRLVIIGVMTMLFFHVFQNIAMGMGMMPITGIPLPFLSYGGSNYVTNVAAIALVMSVTKGRSVASTQTLNMSGLKINIR